MKIILRILLLFFFIIASALIYLSTAGIETSRFNNQIISIIKNFNQDLEIELKKVKIVLDPFNLEINAKTVGPKFKIKDKSLELESVKTKIMIDTIINNNFSLKKLNISTKSLEIGSLISFIRNFKKHTGAIYIRKNFQKRLFNSDVNLEFDDDGKIKENYTVKWSSKRRANKIFKKIQYKRY